jgi:hypothetical protein
MNVRELRGGASVVHAGSSLSLPTFGRWD